MFRLINDSCVLYLTGVINQSRVTCSFPDELKLTEVISAFKKDDPLEKKKLSINKFIIDPNVKKYLKKILFNKINDYMEPT